MKREHIASADVTERHPFTGEISVNSRLDYEQGHREVSFQVQAFTAPPDVRSAAATLRVIVEDINDNIPQFDPAVRRRCDCLWACSIFNPDLHVHVHSVSSTCFNDVTRFVDRATKISACLRAPLRLWWWERSVPVMVTAATTACLSTV